METARLGSSCLTFLDSFSLTWAFRLWNVVVRLGGVDGGRKEELAGGYGGRSWGAGRWSGLRVRALWLPAGRAIPYCAF